MVRSGFCLVTLLGFAAVSSPSDRPVPRVPLARAIAAIRAVLYHHDAAVFDTTDVTGAHAALWNTKIGEGVAGGSPSAVTLVLVQVIGGPFLAETQGGVELQVHVGPARMYSQTVGLNKFFSEQTAIWVPFLIYDETSCTPWKVTATLLTSRGIPESTQTKDIRFACGE